jgi:hypothetical protein
MTGTPTHVHPHFTCTSKDDTTQTLRSQVSNLFRATNATATSSMFGGRANNFSLFLESHVLSVWEERADAFLNAFRLPFPNAFLTMAAVGDMEHVKEGNPKTGVVHDRQEVAACLILLVGMTASCSVIHVQGTAPQTSH